MATLRSLRHGVLPLLALSLALASCTSSTRRDWDARMAAYAALVAAPTPAEWRPGETWRLRSFDADGAVDSEVPLRITDRPIETCTSGEWMALERLDVAQPGGAAVAQAPGTDWAYQVQGRSLGIDPHPAMCDMGSISGALDGARFTGTIGGGPFPAPGYRPLRVEAVHVPSPEGEHR